MACCAKCAKAAKIGKMARRRSGGGGKTSVIKIAKYGVGGAAGLMVGRLLTKNIDALNNNALFAGGAQFALALFVTNMARGNEVIQGAGVALAMNGVAGIIVSTMPEFAAKIGLSGLGAMERPYELASGSTIMPGVAGSLNGLGVLPGVNITVQ